MNKHAGMPTSAGICLQSVDENEFDSDVTMSSLFLFDHQSRAEG